MRWQARPQWIASSSYQYMPKTETKSQRIAEKERSKEKIRYKVDDERNIGVKEDMIIDNLTPRSTPDSIESTLKSESLSLKSAQFLGLKVEKPIAFATTTTTPTIAAAAALQVNVDADYPPRFTSIGSCKILSKMNEGEGSKVGIEREDQIKKSELLTTTTTALQEIVGAINNPPPRTFPSTCCSKALELRKTMLGNGRRKEDELQERENEQEEYDDLVSLGMWDASLALDFFMDEEVLQSSN